ncbi:MAG: hypothetical protein DMG97_30545 [Acidobacteria bacterium]|nr:MAG: hypothetical protein DMG97_30545 [Acidobacteriota bacterium]PYV75049.1 MAG: hypothetical protein DMG96_18485 [Acidobacteriota bacterium]
MKRVIIVFSLCVIGVRSVAATQNETWHRCGVRHDQMPQRVFADPEGKKDWKEYGTLKEVPTLANDAGKYAGLLPGVDGNSLIVTEEPGEDFTAYTYYCFDKKGHLVQLRFEVQTAWGWGFREEGPIVNRHVSFRGIEFFDTKTEESCRNPGLTQMKFLRT